MAAPNSAGETVAFDAFVDRRIAKTRAAVKTADLAVGAVTLLAGLLALLLVAAVADHWVVRGGLDRNERYALLGVGLVGALLYFATRLAPIAFRRVNPLYAAREIERESPALKNSLLNLLQLRGGSESVAVRQTLERQAAERLAQTGDSPIDHSSVVRAAKMLLALVAIVGAYIVATPKDFFASAGRVLAPWADIAAPSRVQVRALTPGDARVNQGESLAVSTEVTGLAEGEVVELVYTTKDGRFVDRRVAMRGGATAMSPWTATLPAESGAAAALGLQSDFTYRIEAGDARTLDYRVEVLTAPMIAPVRVRYDYPAYTGLAPREVEGVGDLRALEGTRVSLTAEANLPIESAEIDLGADGRPDVRMRPEGKQAQGVLTMRLGEAGRSTPTEYVIRFASEEGQSNPSPPRHRIEVVADLAPEAAIVAPEEAVVDVPLDGSMRVEVEARDPDFALSKVRLIGETGGRVVLERDLLTGDGRGKFTAPTELAPAEIGLRPGDVLEYRVEAYDNRAPQPRVGASDRRQLRVIGPAERGEAGEQQPSDGAPQPGQPQEGQPQAGQPGEGNQGAGGGQQENGQQQDGQQPPKAGEPSPDSASQESGESAPGKDQPKENKPNEGEGQEPQGGGLAGPGKEGDAGESNEANPGKGTAGEGETPPEGESGSSGAGGSREGASDGNQGKPSPNGQQGAGAKPQSSKPSQPDGGDGAGEDAQPVARDGSDDRSAFDRMCQWLNQASKSQGGSQKPEQDEGDAPENQSEPSSDANPGEGQSAKGRQDEGQQSQKPNQPAGDAQGQEGASSSDESQQAKGQRGEEAERSDEGRGAGPDDRQGNASDSTSGESGEETPPGDPSDPKAGPRQGTGSSGQNQAADRGAGQSADRGAGETTGKPGDQQQGDKTSGEQGEGQPTDGEGSREAEGQGAKPGGKPPTGEQGSGGQDRPGEGAQPTANGPESKPSGELGDNRSEGAGEGGKPGGDKPGNRGGPMELVDRGATDDGPGEGAESGGDAANLDYARKQTDLVLKKLDEQLRKKEVDRRLLDKLGWTEEDLQRFVDRWQSRQQKAAERGAEGQSELDRALRSLGLKPEGPKATERLSDDQLRDLREAARTQTPPRLRDALDWYQRSVSRAADDADSEE